MTKTITLGKRLVPIEQIALVEPFDPSTQPNIRSTRPFRSRVVLLNRDSILAEVDPTGFAEEHGFRMLPLDGVATNPETNFGVERFEASGDFQPTKPFVSRLSWRDRDGNTQSKLLLSEAEDLLAMVVRGRVASESAEGGTKPTAPAARQRRSRRARAPAEHAPAQG